MKPNLMFIVVLLCLVIGAPLASAQNMTISRLGMGSDETVQLYTANGTLLGTYNTSTNGIGLPDADFNLVVKPESADPLSDPSAWMNDFLDFLSTNLTALAIFAFLVSVLFWRRF